MTDAELKKFWLGIGAIGIANQDGSLTPFTTWQVGQFTVASGPGGYEEWFDPADADKVRLEVLLDGLERLSNGKAFVYYEPSSQDYVVYYSVSTWPQNDLLAENKNRRAAVIAAIHSLIKDNSK